MIGCLVAVEGNQGIGFKGSMPWPHLKGDLQWFRARTVDHVVIMGLNTWNSLGHFQPLPGRVNVVISKTPQEKANHCFTDPETAISFCQSTYPDKDIMIIGGQLLYDSTMHLIEKFYITEIDAYYLHDKVFNLNYVKQNFPNVTEHISYQDPIRYTIKEYSK